ncbi:VOC family protein [Streptomyces sp. NBC_01498]|uniref:VOC family protein n=1 Tax=Streptomyces sp. NBC_01498 TaxID=2975870 RepID=UPI002E7C2731|nr:VOC family protein [Streptomyces sp. NBC_01498]WTL28354.1 VOC family protein [Streptomyces sp. NBC_01498]
MTASTVQPIVVTPGIERLLAFYQGLLRAVETARTPDEGPPFFVNLRIGESDLGLVSDTDVELGAPQRMLLSVAVTDVDGLLGQVEGLGGQVLGPPNDMPWGQRVAHIKDPDGNAVNLTQQL